MFKLVSMFELSCTLASQRPKAIMLHLGLHPDAMYAGLTCDLDEWGVPYEAWPQQDRIKEWEDKGHYNLKKKGHKCIIQVPRHRKCFMVTSPSGVKHVFFFTQTTFPVISLCKESPKSAF